MLLNPNNWNRVRDMLPCYSNRIEVPALWMHCNIGAVEVEDRSWGKDAEDFGGRR